MRTPMALRSMQQRIWIDRVQFEISAAQRCLAGYQRGFPVPRLVSVRIVIRDRLDQRRDADRPLLVWCELVPHGEGSSNARSVALAITDTPSCRASAPPGSPHAVARPENSPAARASLAFRDQAARSNDRGTGCRHGAAQPFAATAVIANVHTRQLGLAAGHRTPQFDAHHDHARGTVSTVACARSEARMVPVVAHGALHVGQQLLQHGVGLALGSVSESHRHREAVDECMQHVDRAVAAGQKLDLFEAASSLPGSPFTRVRHALRSSLIASTMRSGGFHRLRRYRRSMSCSAARRSRSRPSAVRRSSSPRPSSRRITRSRFAMPSKSSASNSRIGRKFPVGDTIEQRTGGFLADTHACRAIAVMNNAAIACHLRQARRVGEVPARSRRGVHRMPSMYVWLGPPLMISSQ